MFEGPESELTLTENAQPALMAASLAVIRVLEAEGGFDLARRCRLCGGAFARRIFGTGGGGCGHASADGGTAAQAAGQAMQQAVPVGEGAMAALLGLDVERGQAVAAEAARPATRSALWQTTMRRAKS